MRSPDSSWASVMHSADAMLVALGAFMIAIGTAQDITLLHGTTASGSIEVALCALTVAALLGASARQLRGDGGAARWTLLGTEVATVPVLARISNLPLDSGRVLWIGYAALIFLVIAGLVFSIPARSAELVAR